MNNCQCADTWTDRSPNHPICSKYTTNKEYMPYCLECGHYPECHEMKNPIFHPNGTCEGKGICIHCGCTLFTKEYDPF